MTQEADRWCKNVKVLIAEIIILYVLCRVQQVLSGQSLQQQPTDLDSIFKVCKCPTTALLQLQMKLNVSLYIWSFTILQHLKENVVTFVKNELKKFQKILSPDYPECLERQSEDEEVLHGEEEEQRRSSREAILKITLNFLRRMKQEELADCLQSSKRIFLNKLFSSSH